MELPRIDLENVRDLMKLMDQYNFDEIEVRDEGKRLHLMRSSGRQLGQPTAVVMPTVVAAGAGAPLTGTTEGDAVDGPGADVKVITSPMVGTFYRAPGPDSSPFVEEGQEVDDEAVLCIIEAMKVMNEIKAECSGELIKILVANGEAVEYGEPLFHVRLSS